MIGPFKGEYRFLSNFYLCPPINMDGVEYISTEHAYQAAKTLDPGYRIRIRAAATCGDAKRLGSRAPLRADWESRKVLVMAGLLRQKFSREPLRGLLLQTGTEELVEVNHWGDRFWGVCDDEGENWLGKLLMDTRRLLVEGQL